MKWQRKLTKSEMAHVRYATDGRCTLDDFKNNRKAQALLDPTHEVCYECRSIAIKLGIES